MLAIPCGVARTIPPSMSADELTKLLEVIFPGLVMLMLVGGLALRLTVKPTVDAMLKLREAIRSDRDQTQQRIARLEEELARLSSGGAPATRALEEGSWSKQAVRED